MIRRHRCSRCSRCGLLAFSLSRQGFQTGGFRTSDWARALVFDTVQALPRSTSKQASNALRVWYLDPNGAPPSNLSA